MSTESRASEASFPYLDDDVVVEVQRGPEPGGPGGAYRAFGETLRGLKTTFARVLEGPVTIQYPEEKTPVYPRFRGRHKLHRFEDTGLEKCVGCSLCAAACPADCIRVVAKENDPENRISAGERHAEVYEINLSRCIFCGYCEVACPFDAITMGHEYEMADYNRSDLIFTKEMLLAEPARAHPAAPRGRVASLVRGQTPYLKVRACHAPPVRSRTIFAVFWLLAAGPPIGAVALSDPPAPAARGLGPAEPLQAALDDAARGLGVPGVTAAVVDDGELVWSGVTGVRRLGGPAVEPSTPFVTASAGKTVVAAMVLRLAEEGRLSVRDRLAEYVPGMPGGRRIRILNLLEHSSGLPDYLYSRRSTSSSTRTRSASGIARRSSTRSAASACASGPAAGSPTRTRTTSRSAA